MNVKVTGPKDYTKIVLVFPGNFHPIHQDSRQENLRGH